MALHQHLDDLINRVLPVVQHFHERGMFAPHAATVDETGELTGRALTTDGTTQLSVAETIEHFECTFRQLAATEQIQASGIFYHSPGIDTSTGVVSLPPAKDTSKCRTLVALLEHASGDAVYLVVPYSGQRPNIKYATGKLVEKPAKVFVHSETKQAKPWWKVW